MDDELLNGTNRVVLDGVMTEKECERILHLANVSSEREAGGLSAQNGARSLPGSFLTGCRICRGWLQRSKVSAHASRDVWGSDCPQGCKSGWTGESRLRSMSSTRWALERNVASSTLGDQRTFVFKAQSYSLTQLAQDGLLNQTDAKLLYELGERVRTLLNSYFRSPSELFVSFTHLVCRSAIAGTCPDITWRVGRVCEPAWVEFLSAFRRPGGQIGPVPPCPCWQLSPWAWHQAVLERTASVHPQRPQVHEGKGKANHSTAAAAWTGLSYNMINMLVWKEAVSWMWIYRFFFPSQCCSLPQRQLRWRRLVLHQQGCKDSHGESLFHQKPFHLTLNSPRISFFPMCPKARVKPGCGRLVGFSSGPVNPHAVSAVTSGRRCALALWFTKEKLYRDMVSVRMRSHSGDLLLRAGCSPAVTCSMMMWQAWLAWATGLWCKCGGSLLVLWHLHFPVCCHVRPVYQLHVTSVQTKQNPRFPELF